MNRRIKELAKDFIMHERFCRYGESVEEDYYEFYPDELEQFVTEIVRDCIKLIEQRKEIDWKFSSDLIWDIRDKFGVE